MWLDNIFRRVASTYMARGIDEWERLDEMISVHEFPQLYALRLSPHMYLATLGGLDNIFTYHDDQDSKATFQKLCRQGSKANNC